MKMSAWVKPLQPKLSHGRHSAISEDILSQLIDIRHPLDILKRIIKREIRTLQFVLSFSNPRSKEIWHCCCQQTVYIATLIIYISSLASSRRCIELNGSEISKTFDQLFTSNCCSDVKGMHGPLWKFYSYLIKIVSARNGDEQILQSNVPIFANDSFEQTAKQIRNKRVTGKREDWYIPTGWPCCSESIALRKGAPRIALPSTEVNACETYGNWCHIRSECMIVSEFLPLFFSSTSCFWKRGTSQSSIN